MNLHTCCGQRKRYRVVEMIPGSRGTLVEQPHNCSDAADVAGVDWAALKAERITTRKESILLR